MIDLIDYYLLRIYATFYRINRVMKLYRGPVFHAANTGAYIPTGYIALLTIQLELWKNTYLQFVSALLIVSIFILLSFYFEKRVKKIAHLLKKETNTKRYTSIFLVNLFIALSYSIFLYHFLEIIE